MFGLTVVGAERVRILLMGLMLAISVSCGSSPSEITSLASYGDDEPSEGLYFLKAVHSDKCIDVSGASVDNGAKIQQWDCHKSKNQTWRLIKKGDAFQIRSALSGKCLDMKDGSKSNGGDVQQWDCADSDNQKFRFEDTGYGHYKITVKSSDKALDISNQCRDNGAQLQQWNDNGGDNQRFELVSAPNSEFLRTEGTQIVDANGKKVQMRGINLGNWLVWEGYLMMGDFNFRTHSQFLESISQVFDSSEKAREFEHQWRLNYVDIKAIEELKKLGYNSVRVPFHYNMFYRDGKLVDSGFQYIDRLIGYCQKNDIRILLDMHAAPGYQNPGDHSDNVNSNEKQPRESVGFWDGDNVKIAASVWKHIAERYKDEKAIWGYDLLNEPVPQAGREHELLPSLIELKKAIRSVDKNHIIVAETSWWASDLSKLDWQDKEIREKSKVSSRWDDNLVYQIHHYGEAKATFGREKITNRLGLPLILGEFGENDNDNLKATHEWAKSNTAGDFLWSFKKVSHDKTLWSIQTNDSYEELKKHVREKTKASDELFKHIIDFAKNNIRNGHESLKLDEDFFAAVRP